MKSWKNAEKEVAKTLGGIRRIRVSYDESVGDVIHPNYSIEVKYGKQIPKHCIVDYPTILHCRKKRFRLIPSKFWNKGSRWGLLNSYNNEKRKKSEFLDKAFRQARKYYPTKKPVVCVKPPYYRGFIIIMEW